MSWYRGWQLLQEAFISLTFRLSMCIISINERKSKADKFYKKNVCRRMNDCYLTWTIPFPFWLCSVLCRLLFFTKNTRVKWQKPCKVIQHLVVRISASRIVIVFRKSCADFSPQPPFNSLPFTSSTSFTSSHSLMMTNNFFCFSFLWHGMFVFPIFSLFSNNWRIILLQNIYTSAQNNTRRLLF